MSQDIQFYPIDLIKENRQVRRSSLSSLLVKKVRISPLKYSQQQKKEFLYNIQAVDKIFMTMG